MTESELRVERIRSWEEWDRAVDAVPAAPVVQGWRWGEFTSRWFGSPVRLQIVADGRMLGLCQLAPRAPGVMWGAGAPVMEEAASDADRLRVLDALRRWCGRKLILPLLAPHSAREGWKRAVEEAEGSVRPRPDLDAMAGTVVLELGREPEAIRAAMDGKWRYELRQAEDADLEVERAEADAGVGVLYGMYRELADEKGFAPVFSGPEIRAVAEVYGADCHVYLARSGGEVCGGALAVRDGSRALYLLGATDSVGRDASAGYLLQWEMLHGLREAGVRHYDLGGVDEDENPGVARFKLRMGGRHVEFPCPFAVVGGLPAAVLDRASRWWISRG